LWRSKASHAGTPRLPARSRARAMKADLWLAFDRQSFKGSVVSMPKREDVNFPVQEQMIVELYSK
ncbi:MAG: hypothetical protein ACM3NO_07320, partial [Deltaproteobacteria bacterium]